MKLLSFVALSCLIEKSYGSFFSSEPSDYGFYNDEMETALFLSLLPDGEEDNTVRQPPEISFGNLHSNIRPRPEPSRADISPERKKRRLESVQKVDPISMSTSHDPCG